MAAVLVAAGRSSGGEGHHETPEAVNLRTYASLRDAPGCAVAIYHLSITNISRAEGRSALAGAAYISGTRLIETGRTVLGGAAHNAGERLEEIGGRAIDYRGKPHVAHAEISVPDGAPAWMGDRQSLWSAVEAVEKRCDARLAKSIIIALPRELSLDQNIELARAFVTGHLVPQGCAIDWAVHCPLDQHGEPQPHLHAQITTREISPDGFGKKLRGLDRKNFVTESRQAWATHANAALERAGRRERIDHRSHADRGLELEPSRKLGAAACARAAQGLASERHAHNLAVRQRNGERLVSRPELALAALQSERAGEITAVDIAELARRHSADPVQRDRVQAALSSWLDRVQAMARTARDVALKLRDRSLAASTSVLDRTAELARQVATRMAQERDKRREADRGR